METYPIRLKVLEWVASMDFASDEDWEEFDNWVNQLEIDPSDQMTVAEKLLHLANVGSGNVRDAAATVFAVVPIPDARLRADVISRMITMAKSDSHIWARYRAVKFLAKHRDFYGVDETLMMVSKADPEEDVCRAAKEALR